MTGRLTRWERSRLKPQQKNCEYVRTLRMTACTAKARSLARTVGCGDTELRSAYCCRIRGENKKAVVEMQ